MTRTQSDILSEYLALDAQSGNRDALSKLAELWTPKLTHRAHRLTGDHEGTREVLQESWIGIAKGLRSLRDPSLFGSWACRIVQHKSADWIKQRARERDLNARLRNAPQDEPNPQPNLEQAFETRSAIAHLDPKLREVVYLFYMDQFTLEQIAIVLGIPLGTAKTRLSKARSQLKTILEHSTLHSSKGAHHE